MAWAAVGGTTSAVLAAESAGSDKDASPAAAEYLRCEYRVDPLGIGEVRPRLSWEMHDARRGAAQTAYQILVASTPEKLAAGEADLWDSGKVASNRREWHTKAGHGIARVPGSALWDADGGQPRSSRPCGRSGCIRPMCKAAGSA
jgi:alpha-L-rhamnosidase